MKYQRIADVLFPCNCYNDVTLFKTSTLHTAQAFSHQIFVESEREKILLGGYSEKKK